MKKVFLAVILSICLMASLIPATVIADTEIDSQGTWGGIDWVLTKDGTLTISPTENEITKKKPWTTPKELYEVGEWPAAVNDAISAIAGWPYDRAKVKKLVIEEGVTSIGSFAVQGFTNLTGEVVIPSTVEYIGQETFQKSPMTKLTFAEGGTKELCIAPGAFKNLAIEELVLPYDRPVHIHCWAFGNCGGLKSITLPTTITKFSGWTHAEYEGMDYVYGSYAGSSDIFTGCSNINTINFGSEEVKAMFFNAQGNKATINKLSPVEIIKEAPTANVEYSTKKPTNKDVSVTITASEKVAIVEGWKSSEDGKTLTKTFKANAKESVKLINTAGNETIVDVEVSNIDKTASSGKNDSEGSPDTGDDMNTVLLFTIMLAILVAGGYTAFCRRKV